MAITFPVDLPDTNIASLDLRMRSVVAVSENPFNGDQQIQEYYGGRWEISVGLGLMDRERAAPWIGFFAALRGQRGTFTLGSYVQQTPQGTAGGTPLVDGGSQTGYSLVTDGWNNLETVLKAGDFIQIDTSLYQVAQDVTSNGSGQATIELWPNLRGHADNSSIITTAPTGVFRLDNNNVTYSELSNKLFSISFSAIEAL